MASKTEGFNALFVQMRIQVSNEDLDAQMSELRIGVDDRTVLFLDRLGRLIADRQDIAWDEMSTFHQEAGLILDELNCCRYAEGSDIHLWVNAAITAACLLIAGSEADGRSVDQLLPRTLLAAKMLGPDAIANYQRGLELIMPGFEPADEGSESWRAMQRIDATCGPCPAPNLLNLGFSLAWSAAGVLLHVPRVKEYFVCLTATVKKDNLLRERELAEAWIEWLGHLEKT